MCGCVWVHVCVFGGEGHMLGHVYDVVGREGGREVCGGVVDSIACC